MGKEEKIGVIDIHSHILPGLDDGAADMEETLSMLKIAWKEGITDIIATPHYRAGRPSAAPAEIAEAVRRVQTAADEEEIPVRLYEGNEILYFSELPEYLREGRVLTLNKSRHVLVEFLPNVQFRSLQNAAENILTAGYGMILAHTERYLCLTQDREHLEFLRELGVQIQINASSVIGKSGGEIKRFADGLLKTDMADYVGTDAHGSRHRRPEVAKCRDMIVKRCGRAYATAVLRGNAAEELGVGYLR